MNAVMTIKRNCEEKEARELEEAFFGLFHTPEIQARRIERMKQAERQARRKAAYEARAQDKARAEAREEYKQRERALNKAHERELADTSASVAAGLTMAASLLALAMIF